MDNTATEQNEKLILRGLDVNGNEAFYTGRAGTGFVSADKAEAFTYTLLAGARLQATNLNRMTALHGWRFIAVPQSYSASRIVALRENLLSIHTGNTRVVNGVAVTCWSADAFEVGTLYKQTLGLAETILLLS